MASEKIGKITSGRNRNIYTVKWNSSTRDVYVHYWGDKFIGKADSVTQAMNMAEGYLRDK